MLFAHVVLTSVAIGAVAASSMTLFAQAPQKVPPKAAVAAQPAAQAAPLPAARSIIDRHIAAIGGRKALLAHSSAHMAGTTTITGSGMSGTFDIYQAKPNRTLLRFTLAGIGEILEGFDGTNGWSTNPMTGPMLSQGKELEQKRFDADFYSDLHDPARYASITTVEKTEFDGRSCYKVSLIRKDGGEDFDFYDAGTGLKAGSIGTRETQMGSVTATQIMLDYKKFGDLLQPTTIKQSSTGVQQVLAVTSVEYDNVAPATFEPPAPIKALIK
jgi:hypothetical protein